MLEHDNGEDAALNEQFTVRDNSIAWPYPRPLSLLLTSSHVVHNLIGVTKMRLVFKSIDVYT